MSGGTPDLDFFAAAYETGSGGPRVPLAAAPRRSASSFVQTNHPGAPGAPGSVARRSALAVGLVAVVVRPGSPPSPYDFGGDSRAVASPAAPDMSAVSQHHLIGGCTGTGEKRSVCACYADELLRHTGHDPQRFAALERDMFKRHQAGQQMPPASYSRPRRPASAVGSGLATAGTTPRTSSAKDQFRAVQENGAPMPAAYNQSAEVCLASG